ncbi:LysE family transporter [Rhizobium daejeonense]|uniref:LysE family transporter n=2 Tax=Rhizobium daejeonense TaxID=240521 RepID=A0A6M1RLN7_9HYPH|nr:LysE family transporter [Rhizobium daejeonense]
MAIMGVAMNRGRASAVALALGILTGSMFWAALAATGISTILTRYAEALFVIKIAGGLYLLYLAYKSAKSALLPGGAPMRTDATVTLSALYRKGLLLHLTNPKSILGWIAIMSLGLRPDAPAYTLAAIVGGCAVIGFSVFIGYALMFSTAVMGRAYRKSRRWVESTLAMVFGFAGIRLLLSKT